MPSSPIFLGPARSILTWESFHLRCEAALGSRLASPRPLTEAELKALGFLAAAAGADVYTRKRGPNAP